MKNLLLIGDSIRMGYDKSVKKTLEGKANVIFPEENCRFASYLLRNFHEYLKDVKGEDIDVVHWNAGLWDCLRLFEEEPHTPIEVYSYYIERLCVRCSWRKSLADRFSALLILREHIRESVRRNVVKGWQLQKT